MFDFTRQERVVLISLTLVLLIGISLNYTFKVNPKLKNMVNIVDSKKLYNPIDLNKATYSELIRVPQIGPVTARRIIEYRKSKGKFKDLSELKDISGIGQSSYNTIIKYLKVYPDGR